ncbi:hypothetical protein [Erythrobacter sp. HKB08]|uniref:hypothetical protein n=1 Tax=Erythrobacter sp. HKB08 TaxID=2502843 RepID=UPI0010089E22|nr:hypothetical protein [Erythrobacter sp. HKB08]
MAELETDYLVIGAGAVGLAFVDTLLEEDPDATFLFVDRHAKPGGHWNDAYSFVTLHQPSAIYGLESTPLGQDRIDTAGPNKGFYELASGAEVLAYFDNAMRDRLLPSGRVQYFPNCNYLGNHSFENLFSGERQTVKVRRKVVDSTYFETSVPATHKRQFDVAEGVRIAIPGDLQDLWKQPEEIPENYVILGGGKTAMDTGVWLLQAGVPADRITWVRPRESWFLNRAFIQPGEQFFEKVIEGQTAIFEEAAKADNVDELFLALEERGFMLRLDKDALPRMFHYPVISTGEIELLRQIENVVRMGRVTSIEADRMVLKEGEVPVAPDTMFIDCTASAVRPKPTRPQFEPGLITLQLLHVPLVTLNAAVTAVIEANFDTDEEKNALGMPVSFIDTIGGYAMTLLGTGMNRMAWANNPVLSKWLAQSRLDPSARTVAWLQANAPERLAVVGKMMQASMAAGPNLQRLAMQAQQQDNAAA